MKLKTFLAHRQKEKSFSSKIIYFIVDEYPVLFCAQLIKRLKETGYPLKVISLDQIDFSSFQASLSTTFLGSVETFWLGDIYSLEAQKRKKILTYLSTYNGPHTVLCSVKEKDLPKDSKEVSVELHEQLQKSDIEMIFNYFWDSSSDKFLATMGTNYKSMSLDNIMLLGSYTVLLGGNTNEFMMSWFERIILPEESLFSLSQFFFARKKDHFFRAWLTVKDDYAAPFWTTFWSEQLWRAYHVINLRNQEQFTQANQISFRLPFSFLQRDWKSVSLNELQKAHDLLYTVDSHVKNGGSMIGLEAFFNKFMLKEF
jgi:hypothetical protein